MGHERAEMAMARRAIRNRWPMSAEFREKIRKQAELILETSESDRAKLGAIKVLMEMDKINLAATSLDIQAEKIEAGKSDVPLSVLETVRQIRESKAARDHERGLTDGQGDRPDALF